MKRWMITIGVVLVLLPSAASEAAPFGTKNLFQVGGGGHQPGMIDGRLSAGSGGIFQEPDPFGGPASDTDFFDSIGFNRRSNQRLADNFITSTAFSIHAVRWWGFYGGPDQSHVPPPGDETMRIRVYGTRTIGGLPDDNNIIFEESFLNASRMATGIGVVAEVDAPEFIFETNLSTPLLLSANTPYWLEIVQIGDVNSHFRWESGFGDQISFAFINNHFPDWQSNGSGNLSFELIAIPEPASLWLFSLGWMFISTKQCCRNNRAF